MFQLGDRLKNQNECEGHILLGAKHTSQVTHKVTETEIYINSQDWVCGGGGGLAGRSGGGGQKRTGERQGREGIDILDN